MSAIVHLTPKAQPEGVDPATLAKLTQAAFSQRRKMLRQSFKSLPGGLAALEAAGIDSSRRPETVSVLEFIEIARQLSA
jgi:16S rRNA (adenine1518-N6/adenine1519-N6)-dimethyltransferase